MDIRLEEFLLFLPLVGSALLIIGSKIYGIEIPKDEEISDPIRQNIFAVSKWWIEGGEFAYSMYFNKPHMRILRLAILACMLPIFPLVFYFIGEISFKYMCAVLCSFTLVSGATHMSELGNESVMVGLGFSQITTLIFLTGLIVSMIGTILAMLFFIEL
ncbi:uncharacterized protein METZ01_LOCUS218235, partial [marine metagenome]